MRKYRPDYLVRLSDGTRLILETKGKVDDEALAKKAAADEWADAVNAMGQFGQWRYAMCDKPQMVLDVL